MTSERGFLNSSVIRKADRKRQLIAAGGIDAFMRVVDAPSHT